MTETSRIANIYTFIQHKGHPLSAGPPLALDMSTLCFPLPISNAGIYGSQLPSLMSPSPLITVTILPNRLALSDGSPILCTLTLRLRGHGESDMPPESLENDMLRPNSRIRAGAVDTTKDVRKGRLARTIRSVDSEV